MRKDQCKISNDQLAILNEKHEEKFFSLYVMNGWKIKDFHPCGRKDPGFPHC